MSVEARLSNTMLHDTNLARTKVRRKTLSDNRRVEHAASSAGRNDLLPGLSVSERKPHSLEPSIHRTRKTDADHLARVITSIRQFGFTVPILRVGNEILDGHVRTAAAIELGLEKIPTIDCGHLSPTEVRTLRLAVNRIAELGTYDVDALKTEFMELIELDVDLEIAGFTMEEVDIVLLDSGPGTSEPEIVPPKVPISRLGDIWVMGDHRVVCGDALSDETYAALLEGKLVDGVIADFPYNVRIGGNVSGLGKKKHDEFVMASGEMSADQFTRFLTDAMKAATAHLVEGSVFFGFMDWRSIDLLYAAGRNAGLEVLNLAVWYKGSGGMGTLYRSAHELVAVFCKGKSPRVNNVKLGKNGRDRTNVWEAAGANRRGSSAASMLHAHATPKPVELCVDAILDVTKPGEAVLDPFLGSGTTLIAAEQAGRKCFGIELDPKFVDVSIQRWEKLTGGEAILFETGETYAETPASRGKANVEEKK